MSNFISFFFCFFLLFLSTPLWRLTQALYSVGVLGALLVNQRIMPIALWLKHSLLLWCFVIGKSHLPRHLHRDTPWHTHTHTIPEGCRERINGSWRSLHHLQNPEPGKAPDAQIYTNTHKQPLVPQANIVAAWAGCCNNYKNLTPCAAMFLLMAVQIGIVKIQHCWSECTCARIYKTTKK